MPELTIPTTETPTTPVPPAPAPSAAVEWSDEVKSAADYYGLTDYLPAAIRILQEVCPPGTAVNLKVSREPETAERRVVVANMPGGTTAEQSHACHESVLDRWTAEMRTHVQRHTTFALYRV